MSGAALLCALLVAHSYPLWFAVWFTVRAWIMRNGKGGAA